MIIFCLAAAVVSLPAGIYFTLSLFDLGEPPMRKATPSQLSLIKERMARSKWNHRNEWLRPCHGRRCIEHAGTGA